MSIGFVGQGYVGKSYADEFERRGHPVVRYSLEEEYRENKEAIRACDIVFIAVPTPTIGGEFDVSTVDDAVALCSPKTIVVVRSTILPGTTDRLQYEYPDRIVLHAPEFLSERTAAIEARNPIMNIIGYAAATPHHRKYAEEVLALLPEASTSFLMTASEAEIMKYAHNIHGVVRVVYTNLLYDLTTTLGCDWNSIRKAMDADPMLSPYYNDPVHKTGRGAGGNCFIKDFAAFRSFYERSIPDEKGRSILRALEGKNIELLLSSGKDLAVIEKVYGTKNPNVV